MSVSSWVTEARQPIANIAAQLGYPSRNRHYPCPAKCEGRTPLPVYSGGEGWRCQRCDARGDAVDLVSYALHGARFRALNPDQKDTVRAWFGAPARADYTPAPAPPPVRPSPEALHAFWSACGPIDVDSAAFLRGRGLDPAALAPWARSVRPSHEAPFWPGGRSRVWRLVTPGWSIGPGGEHEMANVHARAIVDPGERPKTLWGKGLPSSGVVMWNGVRPEDACLVFVAEGVTDFWTACAAGLRDTCIYGATSGGFGALARIRLRPWVSVVVAPDGDAAGDAYMDQIRTALPGRTVGRVALPPREDVNDHIRRGGSVRGLVGEVLSR